LLIGYLILVRLRSSNQVICLPAPCSAIALFVVRCPSECHANQNYLDWAWIWPTELVATATSFEESTKYCNFRSFIYGRSSTNRAILVKIGLVNVEIIGLTYFVEKEKNGSKIESHLRLRFAQVGGLTANFS